MSDSAPPNLTPGDLSFVFVIEGARLQTQSLILADSLRRHHPNADIIAYLPGDGELDPLVRGFLALCDVQLRPVKGQEKQWKQPYPHGNKILSLAEPRDTRWSMFLDTDMAALAPIDPGDLPGPMQVSVVPEGIASWGKDLAKWQTAYDYFDLPMPTERIRLFGAAGWSFRPISTPEWWRSARLTGSRAAISAACGGPPRASLIGAPKCQTNALGSIRSPCR